MIFAWLLLAVLLTIAGAVVAVLTQDEAERHDDELEYEERITGQRAAIALARCETDPTCMVAHDTAQERVSYHQSMNH